MSGFSNKILNILSVETSCDETAAAVLSVADSKPFPEIQTLSSVVKSQIKLHSKMGGVVPEAAARAHIKNILPVVKKAIQDSRFKIQDIDYIAVTAGPGLIPSLIVGVEFAKALALATGKPIIPINHLEGHLYSPFGRENLQFPPQSSDGVARRMTVPISNFQKNPKSKTQNLKSLFPMVSLIVSGGHTILTLMENEKRYRVLGQTVDDAAGEAFDKVAKLLGLPYPGGPEVSKLAKKGNPDAIKFPRPMINSKDYNFSFAGLKTAVLYFLQNEKLKTINDKFKANVCASFQQAVVDVLIAKTMRAAKEFKAKSVSLSGGVSANSELRNQLRNLCKRNNLRFFVPPLGLSTDNAEMIGIAAAFKLHNGFKPIRFDKIKADPNLKL